ncbi:MAG: 16S rRNA (cytosine(967)-C(5))-methyltransferase RsmB [Methylophilaceae bacterium]|nr:16S rRNA (cytosine(967)-C(5))-methyltransferase RsmB [Methylophilaceae bacterium]
MLHNVQSLAATVVGQVVLRSKNLDQALEAVRKRHGELTPPQWAALQDLSYTALRWLGRLQAILDLLLERPLDDGRVRCLLLVALGQLEYGKAPPYAVVDHAVRAATGFGLPWAKGLVNAVLRNFLRRRHTLLSRLDADLTSRFAYPNWWIAKLQAQYPEQWASILAAGNGHPPMTLRVNGRKTTRQAYLARLGENGLDAQPLGESGIMLARPLPVDRLPGFSDGLVSVQDLGAQYAAPLLDVQDGMRVLDACSAPGGKTTHLLELADMDLLALDSDPVRLGRVSDNLRRLGLSATLRQGNAARPEEWWDGRPFDRILADVPCSASGIVRRHPDIKWLRRETDIAGFTLQQAKILHALWSTLAKGGKLLYVTCSVFQEENRRQIEAFLTATPDARCLPLAGLKEGQLLPCDVHDGFYYALMQKT